MITPMALARRWMRRALAQFGQGPAVGHRPDTDMTDLVAALAGSHPGVQPWARSRSPGSEKAAGLSPSERQAVLHARECFGQRFFIGPEAVEGLWAGLGRDFPRWRQDYAAAWEADDRVGIPLYARRGPRLGPEFPWDRLDPGPGGDTMYSKRPHRFAFAPRSALACNHEAGAAAGLHGMLRAWLDCATAGRSRFCYDSNLQVIQRILALSWCWVFLAGREAPPRDHGPELEWLVLQVIQADVRYLEPRLGHSAPNNHLLADRFAGWYLNTVFPEMLTAPDAEAEQRWAAELLAQTYEDGGGIEHSVHYHEFACEMGAAYLLLCRRAGRPPDDPLERRVEALLRYQVALGGPEAAAPHIGNGVEDTLLPLDAGEGWCPGALRELYRALFRPELAPAPAEAISAVRAYWLLGGQLAPAPVRPEPDPGFCAFPDSGLYVHLDHQAGARLCFRAGPAPGRRVVAGHMHADLLGLYVAAGGCALIVDAGTYTYRHPSKDWGPGSPPWRLHFAGGDAHNGPVIPGHDPLGPMSGDFRAFATDTVVEADHHWCADLGVVHATIRSTGPYQGTGRTLILVPGVYWVVLDHVPVPAAGAAEARRVSFQCAPQATISGEAHALDLSARPDGSPLRLVASGNLAPALILEGSTSPLGGWVSPRYGELCAAPQIRYALPAGEEWAAFVLASHRTAAVPSEVTVTILAGGGIACRIRSAEVEDLVLCNARGVDSVCAEEGIEFSGSLLWLRARGERAMELRCLRARRFRSQRYGVQLESEGAGIRSLALDLAAPAPPSGEGLRVLRWPYPRSD